jgi:hypothetical protein
MSLKGISVEQLGRRRSLPEAGRGDCHALTLRRLCIPLFP